MRRFGQCVYEKNIQEPIRRPAIMRLPSNFPFNSSIIESDFCSLHDMLVKVGYS